MKILVNLKARKTPDEQSLTSIYLHTGDVGKKKKHPEKRKKVELYLAGLIHLPFLILPQISSGLPSRLV